MKEHYIMIDYENRFEEAVAREMLAYILMITREGTIAELRKTKSAEDVIRRSYIDTLAFEEVIRQINDFLLSRPEIGNHIDRNAERIGKAAIEKVFGPFEEI